MASRLHSDGRPSTCWGDCETHRCVKGFVRQIIQQYNRNGVASLATPGKGGRRNCYLSWSEEKQLGSVLHLLRYD
jgi:hypothetical protein